MTTGALAAGTRFANRYTIESVLGAGGFAMVYLAVDDEGLLPVALKVLSREVCEDPTSRQRVRREIDSLAAIRHRNVVRLLDHGDVDGQLYLVFERLPGEDLAELLAREGPLSLAVARSLLEQLLDALAAAHRAGVVHRDIKPENIRVFRNPDGTLGARLVDFGIARSTDDDIDVTGTAELVGTPRYMSPEQLTKAPIGPPSDLYSLGVTIIACLVEQRELHGGGWHDQLERLRSGHVFAVGAIAEQDPELLDVLNKMTARAVDRRFASADAAKHALTGATRTLKDPRAARAAWVIPLLVGVALLSVLAMLLLGRSNAPDEKPVTARQNLSFLQPTSVATSKAEPEPEPDPEPAPKVGACGSEPLHATDWPMAAYLPRGYDRDRPHPLLIVYHDDFVRPSDWISKGGLEQLADEHGFVVVGPSSANALGGSAWRGDSGNVEEQTVAAMEFATTAFCIDPRRVFVLGAGHGGAAVYDALCLPWVTGGATYAHHFDHTSECDDPKPLLLLFPTKSRHIPVEGGVDCHGRPSVALKELETRWSERNTCEGHAGFDVPGAACKRWKCETPFTSCLFEGGRNWPNMPRGQIAWLGALSKEARELEECDGPLPVDFQPIQQVGEFFVFIEPLAEDVAFKLR